MPLNIDPSQVSWDTAPTTSAPPIDPNKIKWDTTPTAASVAPAQPSFMERVKNAVTPGPDTLKNTVIGIGAGMYNIGKGAEQLAGHVGAALHVHGAAELEQRTKAERESAISDFAPLRESSTAAKVGNFIGETVPTLAVPGGVEGGVLKRALTSAAAGAGIGAVMEPETPVTGAAKGALFGAAGSGVASLAGKAINAVTGQVPETVIGALGKKYNIPTTLAETVNAAPSRTDIMLERAPGFLGNKGFREQQQQAAHDAAKDFLGRYIADPTAPDIEQGNRSFVSNLYEGVKGLVSQVPNQAINPTETRTVAQDLLSRYPDIFKKFQDTKTEGLVNDIIKGTAPTVNLGGVTTQGIPKTLTFDDLWTLRQGLGEKIGQARLAKQRGEIDNTAYSQMKQLFGAVSNDIDKWATSIGKPEISSKFKAANDAYKNFVVKHDILQRTYDKVTKEVGDQTFFSPQKFATELGKQVAKNKYTKQFTGAEINEMTGLANIMQAVRRAGQYLENPPTANRWGPAALGLGMEGTAYQVAGMTGALRTAGVAAGVASITKFLTTTKLGKNLAMAASKYNPSGRAMARVVNELYSIAPKAAAVGGEEATQSQPTPGLEDSGQIPGKVIPGQGDVALTPTEPGEYITGVDAIMAKGRELSPGQTLSDEQAHAIGKQYYDEETTRLKQLAGNMTPVNNSGINTGYAQSGMVRKENHNALSKREATQVHGNGSAQQSGGKESGGSSVSRERLFGSRQGNKASVQSNDKKEHGKENEKGHSGSLTLVPAVRKNGKTYTGGKDHDSIIKSKNLGLKATNNERGFIGPNGKWYDREAALKYLEKAKPELFKTLKAEGINELRSDDLKKSIRVSRKQKMLDED
jgi:hypothetical protein